MWHWQSCMKIMEKLWGSSFQSNRPTSPVGEKQHFKEKRDNTLCCYHRDFYNYLAGSTDFGNVSFTVPGIHPFFYIGTDAFNHTEEYTEAAGTAARVCWEQMLFLLMKVNCIRWSDDFSHHLFPGHLVCLFSLYLLNALYSSSALFFFFFCARSWKGPVVHPEDSQSSGDDSCGCSVLPCSA